MKKAGSDLKMHYKLLAFMGFWEVFLNLFNIINKLKLCKQHILDFDPDVIILGGGVSNTPFLYNEGKKAVYRKIVGHSVETPIILK